MSLRWEPWNGSQTLRPPNCPPPRSLRSTSREAVHQDLRTSLHQRLFARAIGRLGDHLAPVRD
jgi:hypothetical protein